MIPDQRRTVTQQTATHGLSPVRFPTTARCGSLTALPWRFLAVGTGRSWPLLRTEALAAVMMTAERRLDFSHARVQQTGGIRSHTALRVSTPLFAL